MAKSGPKPFEPTETHRSLVSMCAAAGLTAEQTAAMIIHPVTNKAISRPTLFRIFGKELRDGLPRANVRIAGALYTAAINGDVGAMIFWLKTRANWRETHVIEVTPSPFALDLEKLDEIIDSTETEIRTYRAGGNISSLAAHRKRLAPPGGN